MVARWYAEHIWPDAHVVEGRGSTGSDIRGVPLDIEAKGRTGFSPLAALRQAAKRRKPDHVLPPHAVLRMDGQAEASVGKFIVVRYLEDDTEILGELVLLRAEVQFLRGLAEGLSNG
jgi:hypothetical protein